MIGAGSSLGAEPASGAVLTWLGQAVLFGTLLAVLTWAVLPLFRGRLRPGLEMALWALVLLKFLMPVGPGWSFSFASLCGRFWSAPLAAWVPEDVRDMTTAESVRRAAGAAPAVFSDATAAPNWAALLAVVYVAAVLALGGARLYSYRCFRSRYAALPEADPETRALVEGVCRRLGVRRVPSIRLSDEARATFVVGLFRPLLVLSRCHLVRPNELETVVVHEIAHLRRGDLLVRCLQWLAGTIVFFWPVVAWVNRKIDRARESACDQLALRHGRLAAGEYARCLLEAAKPSPAFPLAYQPACMSGDPRTFERRIDMILLQTDRPTRRPLLRLPTVMLLVLWSGFVLAGTAQGQTKSTPKKVKYAATVQDRDRHAQVVFAQVLEFGAGDLDGDGNIVKEECWAFLAAALLEMPDKVLQAYPEADHDDDGKLSEDEAFLFARGDFDFERLHKALKQDIDKALKAGDEAKAQELKQGLPTRELAVWHPILDRRSQLLEMIERVPSVEAVRRAAASIDRLSKVEKVGDPCKDIAGMKEKAAQLREEATKLGEKKAQFYLQKADELEQKASELKAKVIAKLEAGIEQCKADQQPEKAAELSAKLKEVEAM